MQEYFVSPYFKVEYNNNVNAVLLSGTMNDNKVDIRYVNGFQGTAFDDNIHNYVLDVATYQTGAY